MVARGLIHRMLADGWTGSLLCFPCLDAGFFIRTNDPDTLFEQDGGVFIQLQHGTSTIEKLLRLLDVLPGMKAPGADLLCLEPAANGTG